MTYDTMKALDEIEAALFECPAGVDDTLSKALVALDTLRAALTPPADDEVEEIRARNRRNLQEVTDVSDLLRAVDRLSAELAKERERRVEVDGWQPIETAPKDGTRVLVWSVPIANYYNADEPPHVAIAYWLERRPNEIRMGFHSGWVWHGMAGCTFTHWRPLPTPPATLAKDTP